MGRKTFNRPFDKQFEELVYLKLAEPSFQFWDNSNDDVYDTLPAKGDG
jgi:hypothetical protein